MTIHTLFVFIICFLPIILGNLLSDFPSLPTMNDFPKDTDISKIIQEMEDKMKTTIDLTYPDLPTIDTTLFEEMKTKILSNNMDTIIPPEIFTNTSNETGQPTMPDLTFLYDQIQKNILQEEILSQFKEYINNIESNIFDIQTYIMDIIKEKMSDSSNTKGIQIKEIMEELRHKLKSIIKETMRTSLQQAKEEMHDMFTKERQSPFNKTEAESYIDTIRTTYDKFGILATDKKDIMEDMKDSLRMISSLAIDKDEYSYFETYNTNFTLHATFIEGHIKRTFTTKSARIELPPFEIKNQTLSVVEWTNNPYETLSNKTLLSNVITIMLSDYESSNETRIHNLEEYINFTIPLISNEKNVECIYWDVYVNDWKKDGCIVKDVLQNNVICSCNHLTDFSVTNAQTSQQTQTNTANNGSYLGLTRNQTIGIGVGIGGAAFIGIAIYIVYKLYNKKKITSITSSTTHHVTPSQHENPIHITTTTSNTITTSTTV